MGDLYPTTDVRHRTQDTDKVEGRIQGLDEYNVRTASARSTERYFDFP